MNWLFICGTPRSGTTIIQQVINLFPDTKILDNTNIGTNIQKLFLIRPSHKENFHFTELWKHSGTDINKGTYDIACTIRNWFGNPLWFGDKQNFYSLQENFEIIDKIFPKEKTKWIITDRPIEESILSMSKYYNIDIEKSKEYVLLCKKGIKLLQKNHDFLYIHNKEIHNNPEKCILKLSKFINIDINNFVYNRAIDLIINGNINRCLSLDLDPNKIYKYNKK